MMYLRRGSPHCELMRTTLSVMLSIVRSFRTGTVEASADILYLFFFLLL